MCISHPVICLFAALACLIFQRDCQSDWNDVYRWMVELESKPADIGGNENPTLGANVCRIVAADSTREKLFYFCGHEESIKQLNSDAVVGTDWKNEPFNIKILLHGEKMASYYPFCRYVKTRRLPDRFQIPEPIGTDNLFMFFPIWNIPGRPAPMHLPSGTVFTVEHALRYGRYVLHDESDVILGDRCQLYVSPNAADRVWISKDKPLCVMRRQGRSPVDGRIFWELDTQKVEEVGPNMWLPTRIEHLIYDDVRNPDQPSRRIITEVVNWKFNSEVPGGLFELGMVDGTLQEVSKTNGSTDNKQHRQLSGDGRMEYFDNLAMFYQNSIGLPVNQIENSNRSLITRSLVALLLGLLIGLFFRKKS